MATNQVMNHCKNCRKQTMHLQPSTAHVLHLLLSIVTFGVWILVWFLVAVSNGSQLICSQCGRARGLFGT